MTHLPRRAATITAVLVTVLTLFMSGAAMADSATPEAGSVVAITLAQLGKPYATSASGPSKFDCSGLVTYVFAQAGLLDRIGGQERKAQGFYGLLKTQGRIYTGTPKVGDLAFYGPSASNVEHMGIVTGFNAKGQPLVTSALVNPYGVATEKWNILSVPFLAYGDSGLDPATVTPPPPPTVETVSHDDVMAKLTTYLSLHSDKDIGAAIAGLTGGHVSTTTDEQLNALLDAALAQ